MQTDIAWDLPERIERGILEAMRKSDDHVFTTVSRNGYRRLRNFVREWNILHDQPQYDFCDPRFPMPHVLFMGEPLYWDGSLKDGEIVHKVLDL